MKLFHVSETAQIERFEPRPDDLGNRVVWAIDESHLPNYLLPRECPRVCVRRGACDDRALIAQWLGDKDHTIYVECAWRERIATTALYVYEFDSADFACVDANAGYFQRSTVVYPTYVATIAAPEQAIAARDVALRYVESVWPIQDAVSESTLEFSCIRMRNAGERAL